MIKYQKLFKMLKFQIMLALLEKYRVLYELKDRFQGFVEQDQDRKETLPTIKILF